VRRLGRCLRRNLRYLKAKSEKENALPPQPEGMSKALRTLASTLEPEDAAKLLRKASKMQNAEKLSLKQLKFLLLDSDSDEEEEDVPAKKATKKAPSTRGKGRESQAVKQKKRKTRTGVTRKSSRLTAPEPEIKEVKEEEEVPAPPVSSLSDDDDDEDQLIIDEDSREAEESSLESKEQDVKVQPPPAPPPVKRKRGRPPKRDSIQDDSVSSSNQKDEETSVVSTEDDKRGEEKAGADEVKMEVETVEEEEAEQSSRKTRSRQRHPSQPQGRMSLKSKTWFPGERDAKGVAAAKGTVAVKRKGLLGLLATPKTKADVKSEPKDADKAVFYSSTEVNTRQPPVLKETTVNIVDLRSRLSGLKGIADKLLDKDKEGQSDCAQEIKLPLDKTVTCTNYGDGEAVEESAAHSEGDDLGEFIVTERSADYNHSIAELTNSMKERAAFVPDESLDLKVNEAEKSNLLALVRTWSYVKKEEPSPEDLLAKVELDPYARHRLAKGQGAPKSSKTPAALAQQLSLERVADLFKCAVPACSFSTNNARLFVTHLEEHRTAEVESHEDRGWQRCVYSNRVRL